MKKLSLPKRARLSLRREIEALFTSAQSRSVKIYPIRCTYCRAQSSAVMVSAPKKLFKHAVDRNALKRRMREAYRLNQEIVAPLKLHIALHYIATERLSYKTIEDATKQILLGLSAKFSEPMDS